MRERNEVADAICDLVAFSHAHMDVFCFCILSMGGLH